MKKELISSALALTLLATPALAVGDPILFFRGNFASYAGLEDECLKSESKVKRIVEYAAKMEYKLEQGQIKEFPNKEFPIGLDESVECIVNGVAKATEGQYELYVFEKFGFQSYEVRKIK